MNIAQLETLVLLSRLGNFRKVARKLGTTQPAISIRIRQLERELGVTLFHRDTTRTKLTESGHRLLEYAVGITQLATQLVERAAEDQRQACLLHSGKVGAPGERTAAFTA